MGRHWLAGGGEGSTLREHSVPLRATSPACSRAPADIPYQPHTGPRRSGSGHSVGTQLVGLAAHGPERLRRAKEGASATHGLKGQGTGGDSASALTSPAFRLHLGQCTYAGRETQTCSEAASEPAYLPMPHMVKTCQHTSALTCFGVF